MLDDFWRLRRKRTSSSANFLDESRIRPKKDKLKLHYMYAHAQFMFRIRKRAYLGVFNITGRYDDGSWLHTRRMKMSSKARMQ